MAINTAAKKRVLAADRMGSQSSTHFPNDEPAPKLEESGYEVRNQLDPQELLYDPDEGPDGNVHFRNDGTPDDNKSTGNRVRANAAAKVRKAPASATAVAKIRQTAAARILASEIDMENDEASGFTQGQVPADNPNADFGADETGGPVQAGADCEDGPQATTHFPNGELTGRDDEATQGYLTIGDLTDLGPDSDSVGLGDSGGADGDDEFGGDEEFEDEDEVNADALEDEAGQNPQQSLLDVTDEHEVDAEFDDFQGEPEGEPNEVEDEAVALENESTVANVDDMDLMDVDGMDDEVGAMNTMTAGTILHAMKGNRIIASMTKKMAVKAGHQDMYLSDEFHEATIAECQSYGVRAGLKKMGFVLAKVNVGRSEILNRRVEARTKKVTASIKRSTTASTEALGQCLAIAAVGINRQYFKDTRNELRAALEVELASAGIRGASKLVRRVFASHGVDYAKAILTLANRLVGMPEETRNAFASALDMTSEGDFDQDSGIETEDADAFGDEAGPDFQAEAADEFGPTDDMDEGFEDEFEEEDAAPETIHAALAQGAWRRQRTSVTAKAANYSVQAAAILNGKAKFPSF